MVTIFTSTLHPASAGAAESQAASVAAGLQALRALTSAPGVWCSSPVLRSSASRSRPEASPALTGASGSGCGGQEVWRQQKDMNNGEREDQSSNIFPFERVSPIRFDVSPFKYRQAQATVSMTEQGTPSYLVRRASRIGMRPYSCTSWSWAAKLGHCWGNDTWTLKNRTRGST